MRRIQYHRYGAPDTMRLQDFVLPSPREGEVAVSVVAAAVNPIDWKVRQGELKMMTGRSFPRAMGSDFAGTVTAVGPGVTGLKPGDEVYGITPLKPSGAFAEAVIAPASHLALKPAGLSFEQAAALATPAVMAFAGLVDRARLQAGQRVFVNGATGGVGEAVVQLARSLGATVSGTSGPTSQHRAIGLDRVYDYTAVDPAGQSELQGAFDVVYDTNGFLPVKTATRLLNKSGVYLDINATPAKFAHAAVIRRHKIFFCKPDTKTLTAAADRAAAGGIRMSIGETVRLEDAIGLIAGLEKGRKINGKGLILAGPNN
ncbi:NAD(P)-dependent alcohol dehydrogenase [Streptomyces paludis]|uniref:NAD(P)-dependent alcohol dehydrogenase n=1 Tax=Streptomyces paludis TaxID=2282738 RepID=A0A345HJ78_9ACTN|nr:NAD(P)-dependent alcohol dehydrogenase [Streptomyces paludis]AXG76752.1 NAD(P)-dependent alcohol dehydrogenase [Streptomyces paludis]